MTRLFIRALALGAVLLLSPVAIGSARAAPGTTSPSPVQLLAQTQWLQGPGLYSLRVGLAGASPTDRVQVTVFYQVRTRTEFDSDANGHVNGCCYYQRVVPLAGLTPDAAGGVDIQVPVNQPAPPHNPLGTLQLGATGVFPVQVTLYDSSGKPRGDPLTTFIVYAQNAASAGTLKQLSVALVVPVASAPVVGPNGTLGTPGGTETNRLLQLAEALNADSSVPASLLASPLTLDEVAAGGTGTDHAVMTNMNGATAGGPFQVLPSPYAPVSLGDLQAAAPAEVDRQLETGAAVLHSALDLAPDGRTWVVDGPLDGATLSVLIAHHAQQVIVPDNDLTPLSNEIQITFAGSTYLNYAGTQLRVISADNTLSSRFTSGQPPVLAANVLLAELAMIYTEAPNPLSPRGLAVLPPAGWSASPEFVQTLLSGLQGNPLLQAVTATGLFDDLGQSQGTRYIANSQSPAASLDAAGITNARDRIGELEQILGPSAQLDQLQKQLLLAESSSLSAAQRRVVLDAIAKATDQVQHLASLPPATTITLTSTKGQIPLTVLAAGTAHPRIQLHLRSQRLLFRPFSPREGHCTVLSDRSEEVCVLTLTAQNTTLHVPVETRSSGVFPLDVNLEVPGSTGKSPLQHERDTVRSTAVSGVAVIVIVVALAGLVLWWGRDLRRGRRPKGMVPSPVDVTAGDPDVDGFFERRPPDFGEGGAQDSAMSPSGATTGPSPKSDQNGQARETRKM